MESEKRPCKHGKVGYCNICYPPVEGFMNPLVPIDTDYILKPPPGSFAENYLPPHLRMPPEAEPRKRLYLFPSKQQKPS